MPFDAARVDLILQYSLLVAGEEDDFADRQLGPIHLIKYVYLADLFYARSNEGKTFTGIAWKFYKFGPWSMAVNERIEPALNALRADKKSFQSNYGDKDDWIRWSLRDERLLVEYERKLPACITMHLRRDVHKFKKDTPNLLDHVYRTKPMLSAAPNEDLDFSLAIDSLATTKTEPQTLRMDTLTAKTKKRFAEQMRLLQAKRDSDKLRGTKLINPVSNPRHDEIYEEGISWLDSLAGDQLTPGETKVEFSGDVWNSSARKGDDVS